MADLDLLRSFLAIYRAGSVTRAATVTGRSQPALSAHLRALETALGRPLFTRQATGVVPTAAGHELAGRTGASLDALANAVEQMRGAPGALTGTLYLGGPAELTTTRVLPALAPLVARGLELRVSFDLAAPLLERLAAGELDLVVATKRIGTRGLVYRPLYRETFAFVGAPVWSHVLSARSLREGDPASLRAAPLLAYADDLPIIRRFFKQLLGRPLPRHPEVVVPDLRALLALVCAGAGVSVLPTYLCEGPLSRSELVELVAASLPVSNTLYLANRAGDPTPRTRHAGDLLANAASGW